MVWGTCAVKIEVWGTCTVQIEVWDTCAVKIEVETDIRFFKKGVTFKACQDALWHFVFSKNGDLTNLLKLSRKKLSQSACFIN